MDSDGTFGRHITGDLLYGCGGGVMWWGVAWWSVLRWGVVGGWAGGRASEVGFRASG